MYQLASKDRQTCVDALYKAARGDREAAETALRSVGQRAIGIQRLVDQLVKQADEAEALAAKMEE
jgi:hypothetical protein